LDSSVDYLGRPSDRPLALAYVTGKFETGIRSPLEVAIFKLERPDLETYLEAYVKCDEVPFDFERRRLSIVVQEKNGNNAGSGILIVKGAPEGILQLSTFYESEGRIAPLDPALTDRCRKTFNDLSREGFRLLVSPIAMLTRVEDFQRQTSTPWCWPVTWHLQIRRVRMRQTRSRP